MQLFYTPDIAGELYTLSKEESAHCVRVLRLKEGDELFLTDGKGTLCKAIILSADWKSCQVQVHKTITKYGKRNFHLHLAVAPTKNIARYEWFLEKAIEAGVDEITPLICEHSERAVFNTERMNKIMIAAAKQSLKAYFPILHDAAKFDTFVKKKVEGQKFIAFCEGEQRKHLFQCAEKEKDTLILIGPEGDFSIKEVEQAKAQSFDVVSLGNSRLRTETAAIASCFALNFLNEI